MSSVRLLLAGDVYPNLPNGHLAFRHLGALTRDADIVVGNCEGVYSDNPNPAPSRKSLMVAPRERGAVLSEVPFHVMSLANNHILDGGYSGLTDTTELLQSRGIATVGAGPTLADALRPAVVDRGGQRIAFVAFCSVFPVGYEARPSRAGIAAVRIRTFYADPDPNFWEPGIQPVILTAPFAEDLERYEAAIRAARDMANVVVVLGHWGYSRTTEAIQEYELDLARKAIGHGADIVVCAHHHSLRGVELYGGKPIFYGIGTLVHHIHRAGPHVGTSVETPDAAQHARRFDPEYPYFPFERDCRRSGFASIDIEDGRIRSIGMIPAMIRPDGSTEPVRPHSAELDEYVAYVRRITAGAGFDTAFRPVERSGCAYIEVLASDCREQGHRKMKTR